MISICRICSPHFADVRQCSESTWKTRIDCKTSRLCHCHGHRDESRVSRARSGGPRLGLTVTSPAGPQVVTRRRSRHPGLGPRRVRRSVANAGQWSNLTTALQARRWIRPALPLRPLQSRQLLPHPRLSTRGARGGGGGGALPARGPHVPWHPAATPPAGRRTGPADGKGRAGWCGDREGSGWGGGRGG